MAETLWKFLTTAAAASLVSSALLAAFAVYIYLRRAGRE